ncbi:MAG: hypothetical protein DHS20C16_23830 [Phycisphaerae bacterium]|nr:MAG: hypothetical protein DHS20C16_23830 [Phycisphaerae bacterium]
MNTKLCRVRCAHRRYFTAYAGAHSAPYTCAVTFSLVIALLFSSACNETAQPKTKGKQVIVLGFDGMDPKLSTEMMNQGLLPNFSKLADTGSFKPLGTSTPPQSPVAWTTFTTGTNPGEHGIFDFIHRDPETYSPKFSTSNISTGEVLSIPWGHWKLPVWGESTLAIARNGRAFWEYLTEAGIDAHVYRMPANYPPSESPGPGEFLTLSDMGTPDLTGSPGESSFYTTGSTRHIKNTGGAKAYTLRIKPVGGNVATGEFHGPPDALLDPNKASDAQLYEPITVPFTIFRNKKTDSALIEWEGARVLLKAGEWSDWQTINFGFGPTVAGTATQSMSGKVRMHLRQVKPTIELYVTPVQIDPDAPAMPISIPSDLSAKVSEATGPYFTQGLPEDTQGLRAGILTRDEFLEQAKLIYEERLRLLDYAIENYSDGLLFFYFGSTDQVAHMFWSAMADSHPALTPEESIKYKNTVREVYVEVDKALGKVMTAFPDATIICVSDHGFADFDRGVNLNTWLIENGYAKLKPDGSRSDTSGFDWSATKAYAVGINGLYLNMRGREKHGIVNPIDREDLMNEIRDKLKNFRDPETNRLAIKEVYFADEVYEGDQIIHGPDMQIGYALDYRCGWPTALGGAPKTMLHDNKEAWCSDHCIATDLVPGVIFSNRKVPFPNPDLEDMAPTILSAFGIQPPDTMRGNDVFTEKTARAQQE